MPLYWFFDFDKVVNQNMLLSEIEGSRLFRDALYKVIAKAEKISRRKETKIPL
jgi:hypothetical protein